MPNVIWDNDAGNGIRTGYWINRSSGEITIVSQDESSNVVAIHNKMVKDENRNSRRRRDGSMYVIANVTPGIYMQWRQQYGIDMFNRDHFKAVLRLIDSPEWNPLVSTAEGKFSRSADRVHFIGSRDSSAHPLSSNRAAVVGAGGAAAGGLVDTGAWRG